MQIPIRIISVATTILWIFLIAFFASAVYSTKDVHFNFDAPQAKVIADNYAVFSSNITIKNQGFYDISSFNMTMEILGKNGTVIARNSTFIAVIRRGEETTAICGLKVKINDLMQEGDYSAGSLELVVNIIMSMKIAELIPVQASASFPTTLSWSLHIPKNEIGADTID